MRLAVIAVPYDAGRRGEGVGRGPIQLLGAGIVGVLHEEGHDVVERMVSMPAGTPPHEIARVVAVQRELSRVVQEAVAHGELPIVLAGNCSTAVGTLAARAADAAVVWFDAHADFNTAATTVTGMLDGTALSMVTGREFQAMMASVPGFTPVAEDRVILAGARDIDPAEEDALSRSLIRRVTAERVDVGIAGLLAASGSSPPVYVHLDLDVLDPAEARANRYDAPDGVSRAALLRALDAIVAAAPLYAMAVTAYDPEWDADGRAGATAIDAVRTVVSGR